MSTSLPRGAGDAGRGLRFWLAVLALWAVLAAVLHRVGFPSPDLFAGVLAGAAVALTANSNRKVPDRMSKLAMAIVGVAAGATITVEVLQDVAARPHVILGAAVLTITVTLAAGQLIRFSPHVDNATAIFASIAGGASGLTVMAKDVGADQGIVGSLQYFRVLVVVSSVPLVATLLGGSEAESSTPPGWLEQWQGGLFTGVAIVLGLALARLFRFSASSLILPIVVAAGLVATGRFPSYEVPAAVIALGFAPIGLMVGLSLTRRALRNLLRLMPLALVAMVLSLGGCAAVAWTLTALLDLSFYDAYLATTPGGLHAVAAFAVGSGGDVGLIITSQVARLFCAVSIAGVIAAVINWRRRESPNTEF